MTQKGCAKNAVAGRMFRLVLENRSSNSSLTLASSWTRITSVEILQHLAKQEQGELAWARRVRERAVAALGAEPQAPAEPN
jgi:hypothetical protein